MAARKSAGNVLSEGHVSHIFNHRIPISPTPLPLSPPPPHSPSIAYIFLLTLVWRRVRHEELDDESILTMTPLTMATFRFDARSNAFATAPPPTSRSNSQGRNFLLFFQQRFHRKSASVYPPGFFPLKISINPFISKVIKLTCVN